MKLLLLFFLFLPLPFLQGNYKYDLSICAIFRDEAPYLREWIEYHQLVGVKHFYLFNNESRDAFLTVLQPYMDEGVVELIDWPILANSWEEWIYHVQPSSYQVAINKAAGTSKWLAIIDIDEFLSPIQGDSIPKILEEYEAFGGVCFNWKLFGHSGWWTLPKSQLMIEALIMRAPQNYATNRGVKSIVRPERVKYCAHPHYVEYRDGFYHVASDKKSPIDVDGRTEVVDHSILAINHYWSRCGSYFYKKLKRYQPWTPHLDPEKWQAYLKGLNEEQDTSMERFVAPLRKRLQ